jgi:threonine synthase
MILKNNKKHSSIFPSTHPSTHPTNHPINHPSDHYYYQCFTCKKKWDADFIESNSHYLCPDCERKSQPGMPLIGVLQIFYNYKVLKTKYTRKYFQQIPAGNIFLYPDLWPLKPQQDFSVFNALRLPQNNLRKVNTFQNEEIFIMDETHNPTFSYKDRASILVAAKAIELGKRTICTASTGNAASSMSGICATLGLRSKVFVPDSIPKEKLIQILIYGTDVVKVDGNYDDAFDLAISESQRHGWYNRNTAYNPLTIEGKKSAAFDMIIQMDFQVPDKVFVPVGDGVIMAGIFKGFYDLLQLNVIDKIPQLIAVQSEGSSAVIDYLATKRFVLKTAKTIADSISVDAPRNLYLAADCIERSKGFGIKVTDTEILSAERYLGSNLGIFVEPSAAAAWAGFEKYNQSNKDKDEKIVVLLTGCGLKDSKSAGLSISIKL